MGQIETGGIYDISIDKMAFGGEGIGRVGELVVFVPGAAPCDKLKIKITQLKKNYARGEIVEITDPSPNRVTAPCKYYAKCGGCNFQHIAYQEQLRIKKEIVEDSFFRFAKPLNAKINECIPSDDIFGFRNKIQWVVSPSPQPSPARGEGKLKSVLGLYEKNTHNIVDIDYCLLADEEINALTKLIKSNIVGADPRVCPKHIIIRKSSCNGEIIIVFVTADANAEIFEYLVQNLPVAGVLVNINDKETNVILGKRNILIEGKDFLEEKIAGLFFYYHAASFFQVNIKQINKIVSIISEKVKTFNPKIIWDLYAGAGVLSFPLADLCEKIILVEENKEARDFALKSAGRNNISNIEFITETVEGFLRKTAKNKEKPDLIILDPPRAGCGSEVAGHLKKIGAPKIIYLSCNPVTLARDCKELSGAGYEIDFVQPVDMFPQTYHIETVTVLEK